jgi:hypothetical protein
MAFPTKINLAVALRLVRPSERSAYMALNQMRNRLAHDLNTKIDAAEEHELFKTLVKSLGPEVTEAFTGYNPSDAKASHYLRLAIILLTALTQAKLETLRQSRNEIADLSGRTDIKPSDIDKFRKESWPEVDL